MTTSSKRSITSLFKLSKNQLEAHIKRASMHSFNVIFTAHAQKRMKERAISMDIVMDVLRHGQILRTPEPNTHMGSLECRMERFVAGDWRAAIVALSDINPNVIIVTVF